MKFDWSRLVPWRRPPVTPLRRASDRRRMERRGRLRRQADRSRTVRWDEQRAQFITRYLFGSLGLAYFNSGEPVARSIEYLQAINAVHAAFFALTTLYLLHARRHPGSAKRMRLAMWTDLFGVSAAILADSNLMSPAYLVYLVIIFGNGMRYGLRAFGEAAAGSFLLALTVLALRFPDYMQSLSVTTAFFMLFVAIIVLYSYSLMVNIERAQRHLQTASTNDALTGLLNRRGLQERADELFRSLAASQTPIAVLFADLDGFKAVNDVHGHETGDRLLRRIGQAMTASVRGADVVARFGGDEFVIIMPETDLDQAAIVARRLQATAQALTEDNIALTLTIGIGLVPDHGPELDAIIKRVDAAMYEGKLASGRGSIRRVDGVAVA